MLPVSNELQVRSRLTGGALLCGLLGALLGLCAHQPVQHHSVRRALRLASHPPPGLKAQALSIGLEAQYTLDNNHPEPLHRHVRMDFPWETFRRSIEQLEQGVDPYRSRRGHMIKGYVSPVDGRPEPYALWVPYSYTPSQPAPLIVWLHGHGGFRKWQGIPISRNVQAHAGNAIILSPDARGSLDYVGIQMNEVLRCIQEVTRDYHIDPDRIYAAGHSMGGTGCWYMASRHPRLFAAIAPSASNLSPWAWGFKLPPWKQTYRDLLEKIQLHESSFGGAPNLVHLPILTSHGKDDPVVPVANTREMVEAVRWFAKRQGLPDQVEYHQLPGGHDACTPTQEKIDWLLRHSGAQNKTPKTVFRSPLPAFGPIARAFDEPFVLVVPDLPAEGPEHWSVAIQLIVEEVKAFSREWLRRYHHLPPVLEARSYLAGKLPKGLPVVPRHPIILGGPDINEAAARLVRRAPPFEDYRLPRGIHIPSRRDEQAPPIDIDGVTGTGSSVLYTIVPQLDSDAGTMKDHGFAVLITADDPLAYFQSMRRFGTIATSFALRGRIWFDYALADRRALDDPRLIPVYGFLGPDGELDRSLQYRADQETRLALTGGLWPDTKVPYFLSQQKRGGPLSAVLPDQLSGSLPLTFGTQHNARRPHMGTVEVQDAICFGVPGTLHYRLPAGHWRFKGKVGLDYSNAPPWVKGDDLSQLKNYPQATFRILLDGKVLWESPALSAMGVLEATLSEDGLTRLQRLFIRSYEFEVDGLVGKELTLESLKTQGAIWSFPPAVWEGRFESMDANREGQ